MTFALDPRLVADTFAVADLALSRLLLMNDSRYPWLILVPRREALREIVDLDAVEQALLMEEIAAASRFLRALPSVEKLNVGALGNVVSQLHVHVLGRRAGDPAWPGPVWGAGPRVPYAPVEAEALVARARTSLQGR
ncbi:MAG TPA: HIT family protein [Roseiarcus sp.]|jgi:diadenosine tetraphosphate (Ap4A) HIT family hydrolase